MKFFERYDKVDDVSQVDIPDKKEKKSDKGKRYDDLFDAKLTRCEDKYVENTKKIKEKEQQGHDEISKTGTAAISFSGEGTTGPERSREQKERSKSDKLESSEKNKEPQNRIGLHTSLDKKVKELPRQDLERPGDKESFQGGKYRTVETTEDLVLYRVYGEGADKQGRFLTTERPTDRMNAKIEMALLPQWANSRRFYCEVEIPKGTVLNIGKCEAQKMEGGEMLQGGVEQIMVSDEFVKKNPQNYKEGHLLQFAGNYRLFDKIAKRIEGE